MTLTTRTLKVDVHHLTRVEGHGNIRVLVEGGVLKEAAWEVVETPRYFEVMLKGKHYTTAGPLTARICGICSVGHCLASVRASEAAFGVRIPDLAGKLRLLAKHAETIQSHALHLFFLAAPDFLGLTSAIPLIEFRPDVVGIAARLKGLGNRLSDLVAGRTTHPVSIQVGGMARRPGRAELLGFRTALEQAVPDLHTTVALFKTLELPDFARETEFVSLGGGGEYPWIGGSVVSTDGVDRPESAYRQITNEYATDDNTTKWCKLSRETYAVGTLARLNNNYARLHPEARKVAEAFGLAPVCHNPFMHNVARLVELAHVTYEAIRIIDEVVAAPDDAPTMAEVHPKAGAGTGAVEVPRGILFHHYEYDEKGRIVRADCVIPTTQNNANIHKDLGALVEQYAVDGMTDQKLELLCSMLVRAYDPCVSCSVH